MLKKYEEYIFYYLIIISYYLFKKCHLYQLLYFAFSFNLFTLIFSSYLILILINKCKFVLLLYL
jgi:hypothetical protein